MEDVTVFRTWEEPIADMAIDFLNTDGINAFKVSDMSRSLYPVTVDGLAEIEIRVPEEDVNRAIEIIAVRFSEGNIPDIEENDTDE
ncbi:MAG TPA: hypothetical protein ENH82_01940 [bacterium]|nr:hypothetical protein [bacterium]